MSDVGNQAVWSSVVAGLIWNPATAICQRWLDEKQKQNPLGAPVSDELDSPNVPNGKEMAFSSGYVIEWIPDVGTRIT